LGIRQNKEIPSELLDTILGILEPQAIALVLSLLLPLTIFFAAFLLSISIFTKSFKEAQSIISPLSIVVFLPLIIGVLPGITLNATTALIPILNVSLATKEIIAGTIKPGLLAMVYVSSIVLAGISLYGCSKWFEREETIFRA
jgi:sodium transport system permease protein